jgi:hypothetical protein
LFFVWVRLLHSIIKRYFNVFLIALECHNGSKRKCWVYLSSMCDLYEWSCHCAEVKLGNYSWDDLWIGRTFFEIKLSLFNQIFLHEQWRPNHFFEPLLRIFHLLHHRVSCDIL